mgnify:CR=1 FL=1
MKHEKERVIRRTVELPDNALAEPPERDDGSAEHCVERRLDRSQEEGRAEANALECLAENARFQRREIQFNIRELRHVREASGRS